jgi:ABC-type Zn2+ transport system substrate-binding protein/surface adhesin
VAAELAAHLLAALPAFAAAADQNLGHLETEVARQTQELQRRAVEAGAQAKADATPAACPV